MQNLRKIFEQSLWQVLGKVVTSLSTIIILGMVARNYGEAGVGIFTLALTYLSIFYLLSDFGFNAHVLRNLKSKMPSVKSEWRKLLGIRIVWSVALVILAIGLLPFWSFSTPDFSKAVLFGSMAIVASAVFVTCNLIFQSKLRYDLSVLASSTGTVFGLAAVAWFIFLKLPISYLLFAHLVSWIIIATASLLLIYRLIRTIFPIYDKRYSLDLIHNSWPIATTLALNVIYFRADSFMIAYFKSISDVGIYNVAYSVFQSVLVLPTFIMNAYYPMMLKSLDKVKLVGLGLLGLSVTGTLIASFFSSTIIKILTGGGFVGSSQSLQILSLGFPAYFLSSLLMWILIAKGNYKKMFLLYTSGLILNLVLNYIYIPQYSYIAASWITVISEYFILGLQIMVLWFERK